MHKITRNEVNYAEARLADGSVVSCFRHNVSDMSEDGYIVCVDGQALDTFTRRDRAPAIVALRETMHACGYRI